MPWPLSQDYNEAIQSPQTSMYDPELRGGTPVANSLGMPMPRSGNFADVYEFIGGSGAKWALKCFTRAVPGLRLRYTEINKHLLQAKLPFTVDFEFLERGIRIRGDWYPVLKMQWVEGFLLNEFVRNNIDDPGLLDGLGQIWLRMAKRLGEANMAHADLQHGNVLLVPGSSTNHLAVKLIDYDGMWVPDLADKQSGELGHPSYQHPQRLREGIYRFEVDRFSQLVIYTALRALSVHGKALWDAYDNGDNLLFRREDFETPSRSPLFAQLLRSSLSELRDLAVALIDAARLPLLQAPALQSLATDTSESKQSKQPAPSIDGMAASLPFKDAVPHPDEPRLITNAIRPAASDDYGQKLTDREPSAERAFVDETREDSLSHKPGRRLILGAVVAPILLIAALGINWLRKPPATHDSVASPPIAETPSDAVAPPHVSQPVFAHPPVSPGNPPSNTPVPTISTFDIAPKDISMEPLDERTVSIEIQRQNLKDQIKIEAENCPSGILIEGQIPSGKARGEVKLQLTMDAQPKTHDIELIARSTSNSKVNKSTKLSLTVLPLDLKSDTTQKRISAGLADAGQRQSIVLQLLKQPEPVSTKLLRENSKNVGEAMVSLINGTNSEDQRIALKTLVLVDYWPKQFVPDMLRYVKDVLAKDDPDERLSLVLNLMPNPSREVRDLLRTNQPTKTIKAIGGLLRQQDHSDRKLRAVWVCREIGEAAEETIPDLLNLIVDQREEPRLRGAAATAIRQFGDIMGQIKALEAAHITLAEQKYGRALRISLSPSATVITDAGDPVPNGLQNGVFKDRSKNIHANIEVNEVGDVSEIRISEELFWTSLLQRNNKSDWVSLPDGKVKFDLKDELLRVMGGSGWLRSENRYQDFELRLDFRFSGVAPKQASTGIFLRAAGTGPFPAKYYEVVLREDETLGRIIVRNLPGMKADPDPALLGRVTRKPGEWHSCAILVDGENIEVRVDQILLTRASGFAHEFGHIGLEANVDPLEFKLIRVKPIGLVYVGADTTQSLSPPITPKQVTKKSKDASKGPKVLTVGKAGLSLSGALTTTSLFDNVRAQHYRQVFQIELSAGTRYSVTLQSRQFDTFLRLEDSGGAKIDENDDFKGLGRNSRIEFTALQSGTYRVIATSYQPRETGTFLLSVVRQ